MVPNPTEIMRRDQPIEPFMIGSCRQPQPGMDGGGRRAVGDGRHAGRLDSPAGDAPLLDPAGSGRCVDVRFRDDDRPPDGRFALEWKGFTAEHVAMRGAREYAYDVAGTAHYLAIHDMRLVDGEISLGDAPARRRLDLRDRLTLAPAGCRATGWVSTADRPNSFTAMTFDPDILTEEVERAGWRAGDEPLLYFHDADLRSTLTKLAAVLTRGEPGGGVHAETLGLLALLELDRLRPRARAPAVPDSGALSTRQQRLVRDHIYDNLRGPLTLTELAAVAGLSRFHFSRAFGRTFGKPPHQYILQIRIDRAKTLLARTQAPVADVAGQVGFKTPNHFSAAFRAAVGCTPGRFRRAAT